MEEWRPVVGFEGYYSVSNLGRVRSEDRTFTDKRGVFRRRRGVILRTPPNQDGYPKMSLCKDGRRKDGLVHQEVLNAFVGPRPDPKSEGCHNDGDPANNRLENLRWDTMTNNQRDRVKHGTHVRGERCGTSIYTEAQVKLIRSLKGVLTNRELATIFGRHISGIGLIQARISWRHLP